MEKKTFLIVGLGRFGTALAEKLSSLGQNVIGVDLAAAPVNAVSDKISVAAQLDASDENSLRKVGALYANVAVVTIGKAVEHSILCTSLLVDMGIPLVIARAANSLHAKVLRRVGAHKVISPEWDTGYRMGEQLVYPWYSAFTCIEGSDLVLGKVRPLSEMTGHTLAELKFSQKYGVIVILMEYGGTQHTPLSSRPLCADDRLWLLGHLSDMDKFAAKCAYADIADINDTFFGAR